jgi:hypothetical protein
MMSWFMSLWKLTAVVVRTVVFAEWLDSECRRGWAAHSCLPSDGRFKPRFGKIVAERATQMT